MNRELGTREAFHIRRCLASEYAPADASGLVYRQPLQR